MRGAFNKTQWRMIAAIMIISMTAYLNRLNLAAALNSMIDALNIPAASLTR